MGRPAARGTPTPEITLESVRFLSDHGVLKGCDGDAGWRNEGAPCPEPEWGGSDGAPLSHTMDEPLRMELAVRVEGAAGAPPIAALLGDGPGWLNFAADVPEPGAGPVPVTVTSRRRLSRRIERLQLDIDWSAPGAGVSPSRTSNIVYVTAGRPRDDRQHVYHEDGVTLKRMETAVSWVEPLGTLDPHAITAKLLEKFPMYTLQPSPDVPRKYRHPRYFNDEGGAWAMADYVKQTGECQAIARFIRGILRQLGVPGDLTILVVWADPGVDGGRTPLEADWEKTPTAGLDATATINGQRCVAALVDGPVEEGRVYPPSHTDLGDGTVSPGLNRYEAFLKLTHEGKVLYYAPGAGVYREQDPKLRAFWGLVWASSTEDDGFRVEQIVTRY